MDHLHSSNHSGYSNITRTITIACLCSMFWLKTDTIDPVTIYKQYFIQLIFTENDTKADLCYSQCFFMLSLQGGQMIELNEKFQSLYSSQNQYNESIVLDQFIPLNSSDNTNIISMDNNGQDMVGWLNLADSFQTVLCQVHQFSLQVAPISYCLVGIIPQDIGIQP